LTQIETRRFIMVKSLG